MKVQLKLSFLVFALFIHGCGRGPERVFFPDSLPDPGAAWHSTNTPVPVAMSHVARRIPHDTDASTQGLFYRDGEFIESTGGLGRSSIRRVDATTGEPIIVRRLAPHLFGEGCAPTPSGIVQLTWRNRVALRYAPDTLELLERIQYPREGWGLLYDGETLIASDGSDALYVLDRDTLETLDIIRVRTADGMPVRRLNEMAWVHGVVLANVFMSDHIVAIDRETGLALRFWDLSEIARNEKPRDPEHVLNGIAHDPETGRIWITGKCWANIYEVRLP